jgi:hypothetical protein
MVQTLPKISVPVQAQPVYEITETDKRRQKAIEHAWKAYNGELTPPLQRMEGQPDDNVMTNRCQAIVDRGVDFLFGQEIAISAEEQAPKEAQKVLNSAWGRKESRLPLLQKLSMNGGITGHGFLRIVPEPNGTYRLVVLDPSTIFVQTAPQDCETVVLYCIQYSTAAMVKGSPAQVFYREEIARIDPDNDGDNGDPFADVDAHWSIQHWSRVGERGPWTASGAPIIWPYVFPPIFGCQNLPKPNDFWGIPDITRDLVGVNDSLNFVQSNINRINKLFGAPIIYATGAGEQVIDIKPGKIIGLPLPESKIVSVSLASDIANALAFASNLRSDIDEQSGVPGVATGRLADIPRGTVSGIAIELMFMPLLKKTDKKRCSYGDLIINVSKALFVLNGLSKDIDVSLSWQNPLPHDDLPSIQGALLKKQLGISDKTIQRELGYDPEEESILSPIKNADAIEADKQTNPVTDEAIVPTAAHGETAK